MTPETRRPDIIGVWRDSDGNINVDMFEVRSGDQQLGQLDQTLEDIAENSLPDGVIRGEFKSFNRDAP